MSDKILTIAFYQRKSVRSDWDYQFPQDEIKTFLHLISQELKPFGVTVTTAEEELSIAVKGYADILNSVRLRYPPAGLGNLCLGHVIGGSQNADLVEDLRRGINRVIFAPETVEPDGSDKVVCHNCGCGC
ncbi:MAG TPA: hypothetical protein VJ974_02635 [Geopsychrobacteraceae bacterium]|nr:hypothetical protein [Geopsychrobacteraceae bacterium]